MEKAWNRQAACPARKQACPEVNRRDPNTDAGAGNHSMVLGSVTLLTCVEATPLDISATSGGDAVQPSNSGSSYPLQTCFVGVCAFSASCPHPRPPNLPTL
eukprot:1858446-Amphidinium_carterae.1